MARACAAKGLCSADVAARVEAQLRVHGLPTGCDYAPHDLYEAALSDKKRVGSTMDVITVRDVGHTEVRRLDLPAFEALVAAGVSGSSGEPGRTMTADL